MTVRKTPYIKCLKAYKNKPTTNGCRLFFMQLVLSDTDREVKWRIRNIECYAQAQRYLS